MTTTTTTTTTTEPDATLVVSTPFGPRTVHLTLAPHPYHYDYDTGRPTSVEWVVAPTGYSDDYLWTVGDTVTRSIDADGNIVAS